MITNRVNLAFVLLLTTIILSMVGCGDDDVTDPSVSPLVGTWESTVATINDVEMSHADFWGSGWVGGEVRTEFIFTSSTYTSIDYDASDDVVSTYVGTITLTDTSVTLQTTHKNGSVVDNEPWTVTWAVSGSTLTLSFTDNDDAKVLSYAKAT
jgi:hypothetical protein